MRVRVLRRHILGYSVCLCPIKRTPGFHELKTAACLAGCCNNECFSRKFLTEMDLDINSLEFLTIVVACKIWGHKWSGQSISVQCDSEVSTNIINHDHSRSVYLNKCNWELLYVAANLKFNIRACHVL